MGCSLSTLEDVDQNRRIPKNVGELAVFVPGLRIPKPVNFSQSLGDNLSKSLIERLSGLRTRVVVLASQEAQTAVKPKRKAATQHGGSMLSDLQQSLEDYLPVLLGLVKEGSKLQNSVKFVWVNQEDDTEETAISNAWYEVLSVLHLMAMVSFSQANLSLLPKTSSDGYQQTDESKRNSVDVFLKGAGYLDFALNHVLPQLPAELRKDLPVDLAEGVLQALCQQALGQSVDIQLGMAIDCTKATLAVKQRLACEMVKYWHQAHDNIVKLPLTSGWGEKHQLYVKWKYDEAQAAAYYYHGLILDEGNTEKSHLMDVSSLRAAEEFHKEKKKECEAFHTTPPISKNPPIWGTMKYLSEKIAKDASSKGQINQDLYSHERVIETAPVLPDLSVALKPDEYQLPPNDPLWN
ncbi:uncharacterized protein LOC113303463 isoform X2 [Papaver somniferum]|uniref:uncharacterized protein LOC113303463 isoform X2 n=1 Tax=Papaver somniferum TaxID=3469 RepID=UPI000E6F8CEC|nr:uncharacterized protein LOC113303463 isoform X2 [Papaver somniferum]